MFDVTIQAIQTSLDGLAARQRMIATNLANAETPGYLAQNVNFEDSLRSAMASGDPSQTAITTSSSSNPIGPNGNNVNVDREARMLAENAMRFNVASVLLRGQINSVKEAITGGGA